MSTPDRGRRRPRRIAADEAHSWARNLRLNNHHGKTVLKSLTLYVDGDGYCFVGIEQLAYDCELSADTVRRRLVWLDEIGAIARQSQWLDSSGRRNGEGRGKRTSDLIQLLMDDDRVDLIEARARGENTDDDVYGAAHVSPSSQRGLNSDADSVSPTPALRQPSQSCEGLISEPEPESSPLPPSRGRESASPSVENEPEHFQPTWQSWPGHEVMRRDLALAEFRLLSPDDQRLCRAAVALFVAAQTRLKRTTMPNLHLWIRTGGFREFPHARLPDEPAAQASDEHWIAEGSDDDRAFRFLCHLAKVGSPFVRDHGGERGYFRKSPIGRDVVAMLRFVDQSILRWPIYKPGTPQYAAWQDRFRSWVGKPLPHDPGHGGIHAPCEWPPRKDGTFFEGEAVQPPADNASTAEGAQ